MKAGNGRMRSMTKMALLTCALVSLGGLAHGQEASGDLPEVVFDDQGGRTIVFRAQHFEERQGGQMTADGYHLPMSPKYTACVFRTPYVPITHGNGYAEITVELEMDWNGFLKFTLPKPKTRETNFQFVVGYLHENGRWIDEELEYFHTGLAQNSVMDYDRGDGWYHFIVDTGGFLQHPLKPYPVRMNESIYLEICSVTPMTDVTIKQVKVHTYPVLP